MRDLNTAPATVARNWAASCLAALVLAAPCAALAQTCTSGTPVPTNETWVPAKTKSNGADITIYTGPVDRGGQLQITNGIEKSLWVASTNASSIMKFTTKGKASLYATPTMNSKPEAIAENGKLMYFTEWNTPCAGDIDQSGKITEFPTGQNSTMSTGMATGPDKTTWFGTDELGIGKITSKNKVTLYSFPDQGTQITSITQGPDGDMWFVEFGAGFIGKITPKGTITEYPTGLGDTYSFGIATGSDGRIWFADSGNNSIVAVTTRGVVTDYTAGLTGSPISIAAGPDGNLYFGETAAVIGRITPKGVITEYPFPASAGTFPVISVVSGPDGNIWFTNNAHSQVGMLQLPIKK